MKVLILGWGNSSYIKRHIENVCIPNKLDVTLYSNEIVNRDFLQFYNDLGIKVVTSEFGHSLIYKIPKVRGIAVMIRDYFRLCKSGPYDICHIQGFTNFRGQMVRLISRKYKKLILSFWGSDLLRVEDSHLKKMDSIIKDSQIITLSTEEMKRTFSNHFSMKYVDKIVMTSFPTTVLPSISKLLKKKSVSEVKSHLGIPKDKIVIACGYNASLQQQHIDQLNQLGKLPKKIKKLIYIVIPMTYGGGEEYINIVQKKLMKLDIDGVVITDYLSELEIANLWVGVDLFIHTQITDGFSASLRENLFAGNIVINGGWLEYKELDDKNTFILKVNSVDEISEQIVNIINDFNNYKRKSRKNTEAISGMYSTEEEYEKWSRLYIN